MMEEQIRKTDEGEAPRYASLQDYVRVLRRHRLLVIGTTLAFMIGAFVLSASQEPKYLSQVSLSFRDPVQESAIFGENVIPAQGAAERAAANGELATSQRVAAMVKRDLDSDLTPGELVGRVTTQVDIRSNLLELTAEADDAQLAADIANSFADQLARLRTRQEEAKIERAEEALVDEIKDLRDEPESFTKETSMALAQQRLSRLQTIGDIAEPVLVNQRAVPSAEPASPKPARNTIIGGIVGLVFGLLAAFVRSSLDRKLRTAREVHEELGVPVLGRVSKSALGLPGLAASPNGSRPMGELNFEAFRMLRMNLNFLGPDGSGVRTVLVTSGFPQEGKSTVSMALASAAALAGQRVLLVECDLRRPTFAKRLDVRAEPGLSEYLQGRANPKDILQVVDVYEPRPWAEDLKRGGSKSAAQPAPQGAAKLVCITAGAPSQVPAELLVSQRFQDFLAKVSKTYDLVVVDSSPLLAVADPLELVPQVDGVLLCVRVQQTTRDQVRAVRTAIENVPEDSVGLVVTGFKRGDPDSYDYYYGY